MKKVDLEKHKFDQIVKLCLIVALLVFAGFLSASHSIMASSVVTLIIGLAGGNAIASK